MEIYKIFHFTFDTEKLSWDEHNTINYTYKYKKLNNDSKYDDIIMNVLDDIKDNEQVLIYLEDLPLEACRAISFKLIKINKIFYPFPLTQNQF